MVAMVTRLETVATVVDMSKRLSWCEGNANIVLVEEAYQARSNCMSRDHLVLQGFFL